MSVLLPFLLLIAVVGFVVNMRSSRALVRAAK